MIFAFLSPAAAYFLACVVLGFVLYVLVFFLFAYRQELVAAGQKVGRFIITHRETIMNILKKFGRQAWKHRRVIAAVASEYNVPGAKTCEQLVTLIHEDPEQPNENAAVAVAKIIDALAGASGQRHHRNL